MTPATPGVEADLRSPAAGGCRPACGVDDGEGDYLNCPFTRDEYDAFYEAIVGRRIGDRARLRQGEVLRGCLPIEVMAHRGRDTLRFGPMKPVGLVDPRTGRTPYAAVQLRQDNLAGDHFSLVGFQTQLKWGEQARVLRMIPGLEQRGVRPVRHGAPQHVHQRPDRAARDVADEDARRPVLRRSDLRRRGLRRVGRVRPDRRTQRGRARPRRGAASRRRGRRPSARWRTTCRTPIRATTSRPTSRSASCSPPPVQGRAAGTGAHARSEIRAERRDVGSRPRGSRRWISRAGASAPAGR